MFTASATSSSVVTKAANILMRIIRSPSGSGCAHTSGGGGECLYNCEHSREYLAAALASVLRFTAFHKRDGQERGFSCDTEDQMAIDVRGIAPLLAVFDMSTSIKFYCEGLGFEVVSTDGKPAPQFDWVLL